MTLGDVKIYKAQTKVRNNDDFISTRYSQFIQVCVLGSIRRQQPTPGAALLRDVPTPFCGLKIAFRDLVRA